MAPLKEVFTYNLKYLREIRGYTQEGMAERTGLSMTFVAHIETGRRSPSFESLEILANALDVPVFRLFLPPDGFDEQEIDQATESLRGIVKELFFAISPKKDSD